MNRLIGTLALMATTAGAVAPVAATPPLTAPAVSASFGHYEPKVDYPESVSHSFYLPMRDGVKLAVRVIRPAKDGKPVEGRFPVIWHHTLSISQEPTDGTGNDLSATNAMPNLVRWGYVIVIVARRGNGQSFGERRGYHDRNEAQDAYDLIQWMAEQPWSNGKVGMYGCSNTGDAVMHALSMRPPALKAAFAGCFSWHKYDAFRRGGIFAQWGTGPTRTVAEEMKIAPVDGDEDKKLLAEAVQDHQKSTPLLELWKSMPYRDSFAPSVASRFWAEGSAASYADQIRRSGVPLYIMGGWHDELRDQGLIAHLNVPGSRVVIGPWVHCQNDGFAMLEEMHRFFDLHLKGIDTGLENEPPIHYFTMNAAPGTEWRTTTDWPLPSTRNVLMHFGADTLSERLANEKPRSFTARYDVTCTNVGEGSRIQPCHVPNSGVSYAGPVLGSDQEVTGYPIADLWIASSGTNANVFAYLEDVAPDGKVSVITEGRLRASLRAENKAPWTMPAGVPWHRAYQEDARPLEPGKPAELHFDMMPTSYVFKAGHRIQITVTGSDHRERLRDINPAPTITVYADKDHPSGVTLPFIPAGAR
jgi:putative CocE/NonD family hydrolase